MIAILKFLMRPLKVSVLVISFLTCQKSTAQLIPYSLYSNTPLLTNPASPSLSDYTQLSVHYRRSKVSNYQLPSLSFMLPFYRQANGLRYGGVGANLSSQQSGTGGMYRITTFTGSFAYTIHISHTHHIGAGIGGGLLNKRIDASAITTDSQYNFGAYDASLSTGEDFKANSLTRPVVNTGFCWVVTDESGAERASLGFAAYNLNQPSFAMLQEGTSQSITYIVSGEVVAFRQGAVEISPTFRYLHNGTSVANVGSWVRYTGMKETLLGVALWYKTTGAVVGALQYEGKSYVIAASMDLSTVSGATVNINNAMELSLAWRLNRKEKVSPPKVVTYTPDSKPEGREEEIQPEPVKEEQPLVTEEITVARQEPVESDSVPPLTQEEEELADIQIHFALGSDGLSDEEDDFFDELATTLKNHPDYQLKITGHSCTLGDKAINEMVSYERARAVADELVKRGISEERLMVTGMDYQQPVASNDTEAGRQKNRRVEFEWVKP